ncbi:DMT family transporter [Argonema antarcticum]|uniref:DMT family transporter n=1 Tax=Argonema antarcticum TaxID=2942763 RepID=UPI002012468E|nr:DMT family transporter [Argonema antarcticum]MCL1471878.1 DMT family transporter [Argonema antarcticum A004/B2]
MTNQLELPAQKLFKAPAFMASAALLVANIAISFAAILIKLSEKELGPNATIFYRLAIAGVVFGLWKGVLAIRCRLSENQSEQPEPYTRRDIGLLLVVGIFFLSEQVFWALSLTQTSAAISTLLHNLIPLFTSLGLWLLFRQRFDSKFLVGMVVAIGGAIAIGLEDVQIASVQVQGDAVSLLSALLAAGYLIASEQLRSKFSTITIVLWACASGAGLGLLITPLVEDRLFPNSWQGWLAVISLALIAQVIGQGLLLYSLNWLSSGVVALSNLLIPVLTAIWAWVIFSETLSLSKWLAFAAILLGLYLGISSKYAVKTEISTEASERVDVE